MSERGRLSIEVEIGPDGPSGSARDDEGHRVVFSGWLELIALIEARGRDGDEVTAQGAETRERTE